MNTKTTDDKPRTRGLILQPIEAVALPDAFLKKPTVSAVTGLSGSTIDRKTAARTFPAPIKMGTRCTRWRAADVRAWMAAQTNGGQQ